MREDIDQQQTFNNSYKKPHKVHKTKKVENVERTYIYQLVAHSGLTQKFNATTAKRTVHVQEFCEKTLQKCTGKTK